MKLDNPYSIFNMGDTSIRVKQLVDVNRVILRELQKFMQSNSWERNKAGQETFYKQFLQEIVRIEEDEGIQLFRDFARQRNYTPPNPSKIGLRGRTLTNALVKAGLINSKRQISPVGRNYLQNDLKALDKVEEILGLKQDNLLYLRQFLKLRIYSSDSDQYFYNFRFALKFLVRYDNVPQNDFLKIVESIKPELSKEMLENIINNYEAVSNNNMLFEEYYKANFSTTLRSEEEIASVRTMFAVRDFSEENFSKYFYNRDSSDTSLVYRDFVLTLIQFKETKSIESYTKLLKLAREDKIKKAFSGGKIPFNIGKNDSVEHFLNNNEDHPLLDPNHFNIYLEFIFSKHNDLIREYSDMCRRAFQVTGLIGFDNGLVNLTSKWIVAPLLSILGDDFELCGEESYDDYEDDLSSDWFKDNTLVEILGITDAMVNQLLNQIADYFQVEDLSSIPYVITDKRETEYREFISTHFPKEKVIEILQHIMVRDDEAVYEKVTNNATIPTIYEYMLTIAWYYISKEKNYNIHESFQVTLDGNKLPLSHRGGGAGDIEIVTNDYALLIEATLMDMNTQKRGELEPVIRHATNFSITYKETPQIQTIFIANELDHNVLNIFRATQFIQLSGTNVSGDVDGLNIFALTTDEVVEILKNGKQDVEIFDCIQRHLATEPQFISQNWRAPIIEEILS